MDHPHLRRWAVSLGWKYIMRLACCPLPWQSSWGARPHLFPSPLGAPWAVGIYGWHKEVLWGWRVVVAP